MGADIEERPDGFRLPGRRPGSRAPFRGARVSSGGDHRHGDGARRRRAARRDGPTVVEDVDCIATSYPDFVPTCRMLAGPDAVEIVA